MYSVLIEYREPTFDRGTSAERPPYRWTYRVPASTAGEASETALRLFRQTALLSSVGWVREVVNVVATPQPAS